jgi:broad specificity phosphatase PhoE
VAEKFSGLVDVFVDERLRERSFGVFESLSWQQIEERYPEAARDFIKDPFNYKPEGGESFAEVESRVKDFLCDLLSINRNTLIVAHGGINRIFIKLLLNMDETAVLKLSQDYACVNHFQTDGKFVLAKLINGQVCFDRCI